MTDMDISVSLHNVDVDIVEQFIECVRDRRVLWDPSHEHYWGHIKKKREAWQEIARQLYRDFNNKSCREQSDLSKELQMTWKSIKSTYVKRLKLPERKITRYRNDRMKKLVYAKKLEFLNKTVPSCKKTKQSASEETINVPDLGSVEDGRNTTLLNVSSPGATFKKNKQSLKESLEQSRETVTWQNEKSGGQQKEEFYNICMTVLTTINDLSEIDKLNFRRDILDLTMKYQAQSQLEDRSQPLSIVTEIPYLEYDANQDTDVPNYRQNQLLQQIPSLDVKDFHIDLENEIGNNNQSMLSNFLESVTSKLESTPNKGHLIPQVQSTINNHDRENYPNFTPSTVGNKRPRLSLEDEASATSDEHTVTRESLPMADDVLQETYSSSFLSSSVPSGNQPDQMSRTLQIQSIVGSNHCKVLNCPNSIFETFNLHFF